VQAATDLVNLFYNNQKYCSVYRVWEDINNACPGNKLENCLYDSVIIANAKKNAMQIAMKVHNIVNLLFKQDITTDEEVLRAVDQLGEDYGAVISYLLGLNMRFSTGEAHEHRKVSLPTHFKKFW
jgi:hypothetical protein